MARLNLKDQRGGSSGKFRGECGATILNDNWLMSGTVYLLLLLFWKFAGFLTISKFLLASPGISLPNGIAGSPPFAKNWPKNCREPK